MDHNNIIPIACNTQETTASQRRHFRVLVAVLVTAWAVVLTVAVTLTPLPPLVPFAILAVLVILAEHRFVLFGDETSMSGSMIVIVASVFVFADTAPLAGPVLIASLGGLYFPTSEPAHGTASFSMSPLLGSPQQPQSQSASRAGAMGPPCRTGSVSRFARLSSTGSQTT